MITYSPLTVPNVLGSAAYAVEPFLALLPSALVHGLSVLDLSLVTWVRPFGAAILLLACQYLAEQIGSRVQLAGLQTNVHAYLRRIDFFDSGKIWAFTREPFNLGEELSRGTASPNVLELLPIRTPSDVDQTVTRGRQIMGQWLGGGCHYVDKLVCLLSEACSNVATHSGATGYVTIQKYVRGASVDVELAIVDLGCGIRDSLIQTHGFVAETCSGYIQRALNGLSARGIDEYGFGLGAMRKATTTSGGSLFIRSEEGRLSARQYGTTACDGLSSFPGTQVELVFHSPL